MGRTFQFLREHMRGLLGLVVAVAVAVILVVLFFAYRSRQAEEANRQLARALQIYSAPIDTVDPRPDDLEDPTFADEAGRTASARQAFTELRADFVGTPIGGIAAAYLGDLAAGAGDLEEAESLWREALADSDDTLLAGRLQMSLINLGKSRGDSEAVIAQLREFLSADDGVLPEDVVLFELAKALEQAGRTEEARGTYDRGPGRRSLGCASST